MLSITKNNQLPDIDVFHQEVELLRQQIEPIHQCGNEMAKSLKESTKIMQSDIDLIDQTTRTTLDSLTRLSLLVDRAANKYRELRQRGQNDNTHD